MNNMYNEKIARETLVAAGLELIRNNLIARTWGNISARISDDEFVITPSGIPYERLTPNMMVKVKISDLSHEGDIKPSSEKGIHAKAYLHRKDVNFIIHTHQTYATALSVSYLDMDIEDAELSMVLGNKLVTSKYGMPSTKKLADNVESAIVRNPKANSILLMNHGTLCMGESFEAALDVAGALEELAEKMVNRKLKPEGNDNGGNSENDCEKNAIIDIAKEYVKGRFITFDDSHYVRKLSSLIDNNTYLLDDYVQIAGTNIGTIDVGDLKQASAAAKSAIGKEVKTALNKSNILFIKDIGALIAAPTEDDAKACGMILDKYAITRLYAAGNEAIHKLSSLDAVIQRFIYVKKYSKKAKDL